MTTTIETWVRWQTFAVISISTLITAGLTHIFANGATWRNVITFVAAVALVSAAIYITLRDVRAAVGMAIGATAVYASRVFLANGYVSVLDVVFLLADVVVTPVVATWFISVILIAALVAAMGARRRVWLIALLVFIAAVSIPTAFPALA